MLSSWLGALRRRLTGERRHKPRANAEHVRAVNIQYAAAVKLSRKIGRPPEELLGYHIADRILSRKEQ